MLSGSIVALVTPFRNGEVDLGRLRELVEFHIREGTSAVSPCGTTGESATLTPEEHEKVISEVVQQARGRIPVVAGTGSNSTKEALRLTHYAKKTGANAALIITPYYNKPTQEGLYRHYRVLAEAVDIPIVIYNVPSRTGISISAETVARLVEFKNVVAIKEASGSLDQVSDILRLCKITVLSGDDSLTLPIMSLGGKGVVSVVANIVPKDTAKLVESFLKGNISETTQLHHKLFPLCKAMFIETNPIPVKTAMKLLGRLNGELRMPLCEMSKENENRLSKALRDYKLM
ncbi:MAG TPA: 4-hydroxy-tetrahydrodipicolinate synthase [Candidatus Hypogeohydataceae bacterium YC40]